MEYKYNGLLSLEAQVGIFDFVFAFFNEIRKFLNQIAELFNNFLYSNGASRNSLEISFQSGEQIVCWTIQVTIVQGNIRSIISYFKWSTWNFSFIIGRNSPEEDLSSIIILAILECPGTSDFNTIISAIFNTGSEGFSSGEETFSSSEELKELKRGIKEELHHRIWGYRSIWSHY